MTVSSPSAAAMARFRAGSATESLRLTLWAAVAPQQFQSGTSTE